MKHLKSKKKDKKAKELMQKIRDIPDSTRDLILQKYLNKCTTQHAVKFFKWRSLIKGAELTQAQ